jgi:hypothetical protein
MSGTGDAPTRFNTDSRREYLDLLHETRNSLRDLQGRIAHFDAQQKTMREEVNRLNDAVLCLERINIQVNDLLSWRETLSEPLSVASRLAIATHGARLVMIIIFSAATSILAVAGVLQLVSGLWYRLWH